MEVTLKFDTSDLDQKIELNECMMASNMSAILFEIGHNLRKTCHRTIESKPSEYKTAEDGVDLLMDKINEELEVHNINWDMFG